ncbi:hypothetical protein C1H46_006733 [Malus baccata]|uniref:Zinc finger PHD-type domain-containing protein n=1 Tax=Malus baccata TaxID=106549 RepID=A0A540N9D7_MALBA|nr:hypothetical protein C1H46_006733 [Malus baccata]
MQRQPGAKPTQTNHFKYHLCIQEATGYIGVFPCVSATCGQFYHPHCIAKLIYKGTGVSAEELEKKIALGESFTCPIHKCCICEQGENKKDPQLRFAVCRRCPKSYHRKCLPEKHEMIKDIETPIRDHIKFPGVKEKRTTFTRKKTDFVERKKQQTSESLQDREISVTNKRKLSAKEFYRGQTAPLISKEKLNSSSTAKVGGSRISKKLPAGLDASRKLKVNCVLKKKAKISVAGEQNTSLGDQLYAYGKESLQVKSGKHGKPDGERDMAIFNPASKKLTSAPPL